MAALLRRRESEKKKVLLIDDEKDFTEIVKTALDERGVYEVKAANSGADGLYLAKEFKPDIIFLDIMMGDMDGGTVLSKLQAETETKDIPVVFVTAILTEYEVARNQEIIGGHTFIAKPASIEKLIQCIEEKLP